MTRTVLVLRQLFLAVVFGVTCASGAPEHSQVPRLAVVISIDQFRADYLERFRPWFGSAGFNRMLNNGAVFEQCHYTHATTKTAPGHATILSGSHPSVHGIIYNDWIDTTTWKRQVSVHDADAPIVGLFPPGSHEPSDVDADDGRSPKNFLATTVGDQLKLRFGSRSHVVSLSLKDRAAILMGGKLADSVYWKNGGRFVTSTYYRNELPPWVEAFNERKLPESYFGKTWDRLESKEIYDRAQGPDDVPGETDSMGLGRTFPHPLVGGSHKIDDDFFEAWSTSPFSNDVLELLAKSAVTEEKLGQHEAPDLLCIGFSQIDLVGHYAGPDSHEMMDSVLRLDRVLADFFSFLDEQVGQDHYVVVMTADHGCAPLPELVAARGIPAARVDLKALRATVADAMSKAFGPTGSDEPWAVGDNEGFRFHRDLIERKGVRIDDAARIVKKALMGFEPIAVAYTRNEVLGIDPIAEDRVLKAVRNSFHPTRSQDVVFVLKPYYIERQHAGATHGMPYDYDTHVPLVWMGPGVPAGDHVENVAVVDLAPTLAALLDVPSPPQADGHRLF